MKYKIQIVFLVFLMSIDTIVLHDSIIEEFFSVYMCVLLSVYMCSWEKQMQSGKA